MRRVRTWLATLAICCSIALEATARSLSDYTVSMGSDGSVTLVSSSGDTLTLYDIIDTSEGSGTGITVAGRAYDFVDDEAAFNSRGRSSIHDGSSGLTQGVAYNASNQEVVMYLEGGNNYATFHATRVRDYSLGSTALTVKGSTGNDVITTGSGADTINSGDGNDQVAGSAGADTIDLGAGDDVAFVELADLTEDVLLDGGEGSDTLNFGRIYNVTVSGREYDDSVTFDMSSLGNAVNFENLVGTVGGNDTLTGDEQANILIGSGASDTLYGGSGDDVLYGDFHTADILGYAYGLRQYDVSNSQGNDNLYGGTGSDTLVGNDGDDTLDGGTGADTLTGGDGTDTFVIRSGDGGADVTGADTVTDFTDGTDIIGLDALNYSALTISQGAGDNIEDTVVTITSTSEVLLILQNIAASAINYADFVSTAITPLTLTGTDSDDVLLGGSGNDSFTTGTGNDVLLGYGGDDTFIIDGSGSKTVYGGSGTNTTTISVTGISSLSDYTVSMGSDGSVTLVSSSGDTLTLYDIIDTSEGSGTGITVAGRAYDFVDDEAAFNSRGRSSIHDGSSGLTQGVAYNASNQEVVMYLEGGNNYATFHATRVRDYSLGSTALTVKGSTGNDVITTGSGADTINSGDGNDQVAGSAGADTIDLGAGDDVAFVELADLTEDVLLDGGEGSDTLNFGRIYNVTVSGREYDDSVTFDMSSLGNAVNFENLVGTVGGNDTLTGDEQANILIGSGASDTLYGGSGDDVLYGDFHTADILGYAYGLRQYDVSNSQGNDNLYGGTGSDTLVGNDGDDTLDGGTGADTLTGGDGTDTFVIRSGDGGADVTGADTVTDFTDGTDIIGLDALNYSALTISQGAGDNIEDTVVTITSTSEVLLILQNIAASAINYADFVSTAITPLTLTGTDSDDVLLGGSGNDSFTTGTGNDVLLGYGGDDTFIIDGSGSKTVYGGSGTNTTTISVTGISSLSDYTVSMGSDGSVTLVSSSGDTLTLYDIIDTSEGSGTGITVAGRAYDFVDDEAAFNSRGRSSIHDGSSGLTQGVAYNASNQEVVMYLEGGNNYATFHATRVRDYSLGSTALTVKGSTGNDVITTGSGADTINSGDGNDQVAGSAGADTIDLGAGDDVAFVELADLTEDVLLDGGEGSDTLNFGRIYNVTVSGREYDDSVTFDMSSLGNAVNFENLVGTVGGNDTLTGDEQANILIGSGASDTLYGGSGDDVLYGDFHTADILGYAYGLRQYDVSNSQGNDNLYGGTGSDTLVGNDGDDTLDGGTGADTLTGGDGTDTFVIRSGDGGADVTGADTVTDFTDGTDIIGLSGISFNDLSVEQGTGQNAQDTILRLGVENLLIILDVDANLVSDLDFTPL